MTATETGKTDVLVVGAGPTGLAMASELARRGVSCRIVEKAPAPTLQSRALGIQARTLELFENMGIVQEFTSLGWKSHAINLYAEGQRIAHISFDELDSPFPYLLFLPQSETERILTTHLANLDVRVERAVELTAFMQRGDRVQATLRHSDGYQEAVNTSWLIGCDGAHSTVRKLLDLQFEGTTPETRFVLADVGLHGSQPDDEFYVYVHETGLLGIFPMGHGRYRLIADNPPEDQSPQHPAPTLEECQKIVNMRGPANTLLDDPRWTSYFRIHYRMASKFRKGRVFIAGDAANIHSPAGAQGMNTGIQDAFNLAWKLALVVQGAADPSLLDSYQIERYPVEKSVSRQTGLLTNFASLRNPAAQWVRDRIAPLLLGLDVVQQRMRRTISELAIDYRHSPVVEDHPLHEGPRAGDRAPDAGLVRTDSGVPTRLFEVLRHPRHTLLLLNGVQPDTDVLVRLQEIGTTVQRRYGQYIAAYLVVAGKEPPASPGWNEMLLLDPNHALHDRYGGEQACLYLVRPDGYIAFRSSVKEADRLLSYLARLLRVSRFRETCV